MDVKVQLCARDVSILFFFDSFDTLPWVLSVRLNKKAHQVALQWSLTFLSFISERTARHLPEVARFQNKRPPRILPSERYCPIHPTVSDDYCTTTCNLKTILIML